MQDFDTIELQYLDVESFVESQQCEEFLLTNIDIAELKGSNNE